jgi:hypothetical protein
MMLRVGSLKTRKGGCEIEPPRCGRVAIKDRRKSRLAFGRELSKVDGIQSPGPELDLGSFRFTFAAELVKTTARYPADPNDLTTNE